MLSARLFVRAQQKVMPEDLAKESRPVSSEPGQDSLIGKVIDGRFTIQALVARGAIARVYRAAVAGEERPCALKVFDPRAPDIDDGTFKPNCSRR